MATPSEPIGSYLRRLRQERGLGLRAAARLAGISPSRLGEVETGVDDHTDSPVRPSYGILRKLALAYQQPLAELLALGGYELEPGDDPLEKRLILAWRRLPERHRRGLVLMLEKHGMGVPGLEQAALAAETSGEWL